MIKAFVDEHRDRFGVEPICKVLQFAPSAYRRHAARQRDPALISRRAQRDSELMRHVRRIWDSNMQVYGADKVWKQMHRKGIRVARCTVERLMRSMGLQGARRGSPQFCVCDGAALWLNRPGFEEAPTLEKMEP